MSKKLYFILLTLGAVFAQLKSGATEDFDPDLINSIVSYQLNRFERFYLSQGAAEVVDFYQEILLKREDIGQFELDDSQEDFLEVFDSLKFYASGNSEYLHKQKVFPPYRSYWPFVFLSPDRNRDLVEYSIIADLDHFKKVIVFFEENGIAELDPQSGILLEMANSFNNLTNNAEYLSDLQLVQIHSAIVRKAAFFEELKADIGEKSEVFISLSTAYIFLSNEIRKRINLVNSESSNDQNTLFEYVRSFEKPFGPEVTSPRAVNEAYRNIESEKLERIFTVRES